VVDLLPIRFIKLSNSERKPGSTAARLWFCFDLKCFYIIMAAVSRHVESIRAMKIHLNANCDEVGRGEHLSDIFSVHIGLKKCLSQLLFDLTM
jgi:hypothetical protein